MVASLLRDRAVRPAGNARVKTNAGELVFQDARTTGSRPSVSILRGFARYGLEHHRGCLHGQLAKDAGELREQWGCAAFGLGAWSRAAHHKRYAWAFRLQCGLAEAFLPLRLCSIEAGKFIATTPPSGPWRFHDFARR